MSAERKWQAGGGSYSILLGGGPMREFVAIRASQSNDLAACSAATGTTFVVGNWFATYTTG